MYCCINCFTELEIKEFISEENIFNNCGFCGSEHVLTRSLEEVGEFIRIGFNRAYEHVEGFTGAMWDSEDKKYIGRGGEEAGESILEILYWAEAIFSELHDEESAAILLESLIKESGPSDRDKMQGADDELEDICNPSFVKRNDLYGSEVIAESYAWRKFKHTCKYFNRYFDLGNEHSSRDRLLKNLEKTFNQMGTLIESNQTLYRARGMGESLINDTENTNWYAELGPAPAKYAANNRMSPSGISYIYLANNIETTLLEIHVKNGDRVILGEFKTKLGLNIIDLSKEINITPLSIFNKDYNHDDIWLNEFISDFIKEISKPIKDSDKSFEYVPTQVLSEFIRKLGFEGIKFESSLKKGTYNYVLFCGPNPRTVREHYDYDYFELNEQEITYFDRWLSLEKVIELKINQKPIFQKEKEITEIKNIENSLLPFGSENFKRIQEITEQLIELNNVLSSGYKISVNGEIKEDFNLIKEVDQFITNNKTNAIDYSIGVQEGFHFISIYLKKNAINYADSVSIEFSCIRKDADKLWDRIVY